MGMASDLHTADHWRNARVNKHAVPHHHLRNAYLDKAATSYLSGSAAPHVQESAWHAGRHGQHADLYYGRRDGGPEASGMSARLGPRPSGFSPSSAAAVLS